MARYDKKDEPAYLNDKPPEALHKITIMIVDIKMRMPNFMPQRPEEAAQWWIAHQEPMSKQEWPRRVNVAGKEGTRWLTPYIDRLSYTLMLFLNLKPIDQKFIIGAFEDGIHWRGDDMDFFSSVCDENMKMQKDKPAYISQAKTIARSVIRK